MKVLFILNYSFPSSNAPSNRILSIAKGLVLQGNDVDVLSIQATSRGDEKRNLGYDGITTFASTKTNKRQNNFIDRNIDKIVGKFRSFSTIFKLNSKKKYDVVFLPIGSVFLNTFYYLIFKLLKIKVLQERSEYPEIYKRSLISKLSYNSYKFFFVRLLDGMVVMTNNLKDYYSKILSKKAKIIVIPMSVDLDRFNIIKDLKEKYIAYCGNISNKKDGVDILIKSFSKILQNYPDFKLYLIGGSSSKNLLSELELLCKELDISDQVVFTGKVSADEMPQLLCNAQVLALARPSSLQAQGGFPTKLGEYLATKNPVVVTNVGEIGQYLEDGVSAFISAPDSVNAFADKLDQCLSDIDRANKIGIEGYEVANNNFYYKSQSEALNDFLKNL